MSRTPLFRMLKVSLNKNHNDNEEKKEITPEVRESRREFLKYSAAAFVGSTFFSFPKLAFPQENPVVILGGGVSGLACAYNLMRAGIHCEIYEGWSRMGGRMFTKFNFNGQGQFCELGAELVNTTDVHLVGLAKQLNIQLQSFEGWAKKQKGGDNYWIGEKLYTEKDFVKALAPLKSIIAKHKKEMATEAGESKYDKMNGKTYLNSLRNHAEKWIIDALDIAYANELGLPTEKQSALTIIDMMSLDHKIELFGEEADEMWRVKGGNSNLIKGIEKSIKGKVKINLGHRLVKVSDNGIQTTLTFSNGKQVKTSKVVSTIPFWSLRKIEGLDKIGLHPGKLKFIKEVGMGKNTKHMLGFRSKYWEGFLGNSIVYSDLSPSQAFWDTSRAQKGNAGIYTNFLVDYHHAHKKVNPHYQLNHLEKFMPGIRKQFDGRHATHHWPTNELIGGSYTCVMPGQWKLWDYGKQTELKGRWHFGGEQTSDNWYGFMQGGIDAGFRCAEEIKQELTQKKTSRRSLLRREKFV
jgi:monoamine oxidase